jgi:type VI secretion system protein ImpF
VLLQLLSDDNPAALDEIPENISDNRVLAAELLMLLSSRPRDYHVSDVPEICQSVINYGISDLFPGEISRSDRNVILESRILRALQLFEPRLKNVTVSAGNESYGCCSFIIAAEKDNAPVRFHLEWDDVLSHFLLRS